MSELRVRQPRFADNRWYTSSAPALREEIEDYLTKTPPQPEIGDLIGLVAPHAGYFFSGHVAAASFANLEAGAFETVILIGPDHQGATSGQIATPDVDAEESAGESWRTCSRMESNFDSSGRGAAAGGGARGL